VRRYLVNVGVVCAMLAVEFALRRQGVLLVWRLFAMGVVSAVLLGTVAWCRQRRIE